MRSQLNACICEWIRVPETCRDLCENLTAAMSIYDIRQAAQKIGKLTEANSSSGSVKNKSNLCKNQRKLRELRELYLHKTYARYNKL